MRRYDVANQSIGLKDFNVNGINGDVIIQIIDRCGRIEIEELPLQLRFVRSCKLRGRVDRLASEQMTRCQPVGREVVAPLGGRQPSDDLVRPIPQGDEQDQPDGQPDEARVGEDAQAPDPPPLDQATVTATPEVCACPVEIAWKTVSTLPV